MNIKKDFLPMALLLFTGNCLALDWFADPAFSFTERYNDNILFLRSNLGAAPHSLISTFSPSLQFGYVADNNELTGNLTWNQLIYHDIPDLDFSEKIANLNYTYNAERWKGTLGLNYGYQSSLGTQLGVNGSGYEGAQVGRYVESAAPTVIYQLSEKNSLELDYSYQGVRFAAHPIAVAFSNYTNQSLNAIATHNYTERLSFNLNAGYSVYDATNTYSEGNLIAYPESNNLITLIPQQYPYQLNYSQKTKTLNYQLGFKYNYDEKTTLAANAGIRQTTSNYEDKYNAPGLSCFPSSGASVYATPYSPNLTAPCPNLSTSSSGNTSGNIYSATLKRNFEQGDLSLSFNQQLSPASTGTVQTTTTFNAYAGYNLDERWRFELTGSYLKAETVSANLALINSYIYYNRTLLSIKPNLEWKWTPDIHLGLSYTYNDQNYYLANQSAYQNIVQLQFVYQPSINRQVK